MIFLPILLSSDDAPKPIHQYNSALHVIADAKSRRSSVRRLRKRARAQNNRCKNWTTKYETVPHTAFFSIVSAGLCDSERRDETATLGSTKPIARQYVRYQHPCFEERHAPELATSCPPAIEHFIPMRFTTPCHLEESHCSRRLIPGMPTCCLKSPRFSPVRNKYWKVR